MRLNESGVESAALARFLVRRMDGTVLNGAGLRDISLKPKPSGGALTLVGGSDVLRTGLPAKAQCL